MAMSLAVWRRLTVLAAGAIALAVAVAAGLGALPFVAALLLALLLDPIVRRLRRLGAGPSLAAALATALATFVTLGIAFGALPFLLRDAQELASTLASNLDALADRLGVLWARWLPEAEPLHETLRKQAEGLASSLTGVGPALEGLASVGGILVTTVFFIVLVPVVLFFFLKEGRSFRDGLVRMLPRPYHGRARELFNAIGDGLGGYLRGQGLVCATQAAFHATGLVLLGLDFGLLIGLMTGVAAIVPIIGNAVMLTVALLVAVIQFESVFWVLGVLALYGAAQVLETLFLVPLLIGHRIALHPLLMIVAVILGGRLFGLPGALLALPGTTVLVVVGRWFWGLYRSSAVYGTRASARDDAPPAHRRAAGERRRRAT
jgi:predicted PurR-regulated permease PerM